MPVRAGTKNLKNSAEDWNLLGCRLIGPKPCAARTAHARSTSPTRILNGADQASRNLILSIPRIMTAMVISQKITKLAQVSHQDRPRNRQKTVSKAWIDCPPVH